MRDFTVHVAALLVLFTALCPPVRAETGTITQFDDKSAVILAYFAVGRDNDPGASVTTEQFTDQMNELAKGGYNVLPLPAIVSALKAGKKLPDRTVSITFDGADESVLDVALPVLAKRKLPFTVFIPAEEVEKESPHKLNWGDLKTLKATGFATFGVHPARYERLVDGAEAETRRQVNNSVALVRKRLDVTPQYFAYPFGEQSASYRSVIAAMGFSAAFGQQSGPASAGDDVFALPRFVMTERSGDMDRFVMVTDSMPLPVTDLSPADPYLTTLQPPIGFTLPELAAGDFEKLSCSSSNQAAPKLEIIGNRAEVRLEKISDQSVAINCILPGPDEDHRRWRWLGLLFTVPEKLLSPPSAPPDAAAAVDRLEE